MNLNDYDVLSMNLSLLSYDSISKLNEKSFQQANSSMMCSIIHFLLVELNPSNIDILRLCYPVVTLSDLKLFKDTIYPLLQSVLPNEIVPGRSVLDSGKGERLVSFLRKFSDFVIRSKIPSKAQMDYVPELIGSGIKGDSEIILKMKKKILMTHISRLKEEIVEKSKKINDIQEKWKNYANKLETKSEELINENKIIKNKINALLKKGSSGYTEIASIDRAPKIENHKVYLNLIDSIHKKFVDEEEFKNNIGYIDENNDLYDTITPETLGKKENENVLILQEEAKRFDERLIKDNQNKKENNSNGELNVVLNKMMTKIHIITENLDKIKQAIDEQSNS